MWFAFWSLAFARCGHRRRNSLVSHADAPVLRRELSHRVAQTYLFSGSRQPSNNPYLVIEVSARLVRNLDVLHAPVRPARRIVVCGLGFTNELKVLVVDAD